MKTISLPATHAARLLSLVRGVEPVPYARSRTWGLLVRLGRCERLLERPALDAPHLHRGAGWSRPQPYRFGSRQAALAFAREVGLITCDMARADR